MPDTILIAILCVIIGILGGALLVSLIKSRTFKTKKPLLKSIEKDKAKAVKKEKMEFSKRILLVSGIISVIIIGFAMYIIYMGAVSGYGSDSTSLNVLLTGLFAQISTSLSFYFWKSKQENIIKLESTYGRKIEVHNDIDEFNNNNYTGI